MPGEFLVIPRLVVAGTARLPVGHPLPQNRPVSQVQGDDPAVKQASIPVENIKGPILLISGDDDQLSPSTLMSKMIMDRLREHKHPFPYKHLRYKGAGHAINLPDLPREAYPTKITHPLTHIVYDLGGDPDINAEAGKQAWNEVLTFLKEHSC